jgi:hypothetical protein
MPYDRWELLGTRLSSRRGELGYSTRAALARDRKIREMTCEYIETATVGRVERLDVGTLRLIARAYAVTYESMLALLHGGKDELKPVSPAEPPPARAPKRPGRNRKRLAIWAPEDRWKLLGELLEERRRVGLGYVFRTTFARARLPLTPDGNPNTRRVDDLESNRRPNRWPPGTLKEMAAAYQVLYEWPPGPEGESMRAAAAPRTGPMLDVLAGEADVLAAAPAGQVHAVPAGAPPAGGPDGWQPPVADKAQRAADAPYAAPILDRLLELADAGIIDPDGAQVFPDAPGDAKAWDGIGARLPVRDRAWFIAIVRRRAAARAGNSGTGAAGA